MKLTKGFSVRGECFGIDVRPRSKKVHGTDSPTLAILVEDDGNWHENEEFDAYWLDELLDLLGTIAARLKKNPRHPQRGKGKSK
jgi:hypothetical protein